MSLNQIVLQGRACGNPEIRYTQSQKPVATFVLAVDRDYAPAGEKRETDFITIVAWNKTAEFCDQYVIKGMAFVVTGRLQMQQWEDKHGNKRTSAEVVADRVYFGESKRQEQKPEYKPAGKPVDVDASGFQELAEDGDLPF